MKNRSTRPSFLRWAIRAALALLVFPAVAAETPNLLVIVAGSWKLVANGDFFSKSPEVKATWELYDLSTDPAESKDVAGQHPEKVAELRKLLREFGSWQKAGVGGYSEGREGFKAPKDWIIGG